MKSEYLASLLYLQAQGRIFCEAFRGASAAALAHDPEGQLAEVMASEVMMTLSAELRAVCVTVPGAREVIALAIHPQNQTPETS